MQNLLNATDAQRQTAIEQVQRKLERRVLVAMKTGQHAAFGSEYEIKVQRTADGYTVNGQAHDLDGALAEIATYQYDGITGLVKA